MYIKITNKCNMQCGHCCYSCNSSGEDMSLDMFAYILSEYAPSVISAGNLITIGGGEPTLHPNFWKIIELSIKTGPTWVCTNGKLANDALKLASLGKQGIITSVLSQDKWHDKINSYVVKSFKEGLVKEKRSWGNEWVSKNPGDKRQIRQMKIKYRVGRASSGYTGCCCKQVQIQPDGIMTFCGCEDAPVIGSVAKGRLPEYKDVPWSGMCYKEYGR